MHRSLAALTISFLAVGLFAAKSKKPDAMVSLKFSPQESVGINSLALPESMLERTIEIRSKDARNQEDGFVVGSGTDDDDRLFPIRATTDPIEFVGNAIGQIADGQGLKKAAPADRRLEIGVQRFLVNESNKAVGSTYSAEVHLAYTLSDSNGKKLIEGAASGTANRYGRARSGANMSEVLSDALKQAFLRVLDDPNVQASWISGKSPSQSNVSPGKERTEESAEEKLKKLDELLKKGLITKEEHKAARAKILEEI